MTGCTVFIRRNDSTTSGYTMTLEQARDWSKKVISDPRAFVDFIQVKVTDTGTRYQWSRGKGWVTKTA